MKYFFYTFIIIFGLLSCEKTLEIDYPSQIQSILDKGKANFENENYTAAIEFYNQALALSDDEQIDLRILRSKGLAFCYLEALDSSIIVLNKADSLAVSQGNLEAINEINLNLSSSYLSKGNYLECMKKLKICQALSETLGDSTIWGYTLLNQASIYSDKGAYDIASKYAYEALQILDKFESNKYQTSANNLIGTINLELQDYTTAKEYYLKALEGRKKLNYAYGIAGSYNNIGNVYKATKDYETALLYFDSSLAIKDTLGIADYTATTLANIGEIHSIRRNYLASLQFYKKSLQLREIDKNPKVLAVGHASLAQVYLDLQQNEEAKHHILIAQNLADSIEAMSEQKLVYGLWKSYFKSQNNIDKSFEYAQLEDQMKDSIISIEKSNVVALLDIEYKTEDRIKAIQFHQKRSRKRMLLLIVSIGFIFLIAGFYILTTLRLKQKLKSISEEVVRLKQLESERSTEGFRNLLIQKYGITEKRYQIWELIASGYTAADIAKRMEVSENTIKTQRKRLYEKLNVNSTRKNVDAAQKFLLEKYAYMDAE